MDNQEPDKRIRKIVNEEIDRRRREVLKATYPPELWKALQPIIHPRHFNHSDSQGVQTPPEP